MPVALTERQVALLKAIEKERGESGQTYLFPSYMAFKLKVSEEDVIADLTALEAAKKIRRIGKPEIVKGGSDDTPDALCIIVAPVLSAAERVRRYREAQKSKGRRKVELWLTPEEEESVRRLLEDLRKHGPSLFD